MDAAICEDNSGSLRACFAPPPTAVHAALSLIDRAADALLASDTELAADLIAQADMPAIFEFVERMWGRVDPKLHRYRPVPNAPEPTSFEGPHMPSQKEQRAVYLRDGWHCRFCGIGVISPRVIDKLRKAFPQVLRWGDRNWGKHSGFMALHAVVDHVVPRSRGGSNERSNLVTTCWPCNFARNQWTLEEVGMRDPFLTEPVINQWDGLTRLDNLRLPVVPPPLLPTVKMAKERSIGRLIESWRRIGGPERLRADCHGYVVDNAANLIEGVTFNGFESELSQGQGSELEGDPSKFSAIHSSAALAANTFGPFKQKPQDLLLPGQQGFQSVEFERACPTLLPTTAPQLDVFCTGSGGTIMAIESKCTEYLTVKFANFSKKYEALRTELETGWAEAFRSLSVSPKQFAPLDVAQLIKHYLGLRNSCKGQDVTLFYLYWEPTDAVEHAVFRDHRRQIELFSRLVEGSSIQFIAQSYPELWALWRSEGRDWVPAHAARLQERYCVSLA